MGRAPCCDKNGLKKGPWTPEEDQKLVDYIQENGYGNWRTLPKNAGLERCGKSCRLRWTNYLRPDIKRGKFSFQEEETIIQLHSVLGNKWSAIASRLPGRTDNEIKNYWNTHIRKRLLKMGIDPVTHSPRLDLLDLSTLLKNPQPCINFTRLLGLQPLINPDLLRLATSLASSDQDFLFHNNNNNFHQADLIVDDSQNPPPFPQNCQIAPTPPTDFTLPATACFDASSIQFNNGYEQFPQNLSEFGPAQSIEWLRANGPSILPAFSDDNNHGPDMMGCRYYGSDGSAEMTSSTYQSNGSNNFGFHSVMSGLSTPSSSPTPLHESSSTYTNYNNNNSNNNSNNNNNNIMEDEKESYRSNMLKLEMQEILDVNDFI